MLDAVSDVLQVVLRSAYTWFALLVVWCLAGPYLLGVRPRTRKEWLLIAITIAFLAWLLPMMVSLRSR
jgi:hypothetical protein